MLRTVFARLDLKAARSAIDLHLLLAGLDGERDAEDGDPALVVFANHQCRFVLIAHVRWGGPVTQAHYRDATRYRLVQ